LSAVAGLHRVGLQSRPGRFDDGEHGCVVRLPFVEDLTQHGGQWPIGRLDGMGVHPEGHGRIGVAEPVGHGPDVVAARKKLVVSGYRSATGTPVPARSRALPTVVGHTVVVWEYEG